MANETISLGTDPGGSQFYSGALGAFFKFPSAPSARTALLDLSGGAGHIRVSLNTDLSILFECSVSPWSIPNLTSAVLTTGAWYWICGGPGCDSNQQTFSGLIITLAGTDAGSTSGTNGVYHSARVDLTGVFAVGVPISSAYAAFPNNAGGGWLWSKPRVMTTNFGGGWLPKGGPFVAPTVDWTLGGVGSNGGAWNCRESAGAQSSLDDISSNDIPLLAASQGLTVATEGPFP